MPDEANRVTTDLGRVSIVPKGRYDPAAEYTRLDYVLYGDDGYLARRSGLKGVTPADGENWMLCVGSGSAKMARSWAAGGTGQRDGEETDNAKYYAQQARLSREKAAESVRIISDNAEAIQDIRENLKDIKSVSGGMEDVQAVSGAMGHVQTVSAGMEAVRTAVEYMEAIKAAPEAAGRAEEASGEAGLSAQRAEEAADRAQSIAQGAKGYYESPESLRGSVREGAAGDWAIVGSTDTVWVWDSDGGGWKDSHQATDLSNYYTKDQTDGEISLLSGTVTGELAGIRETLSAGLAGKLDRTATAAGAEKVVHALTFTGAAEGSYDGSSAMSVAIPVPGTAEPKAPGAASAGSGAAFARADHVHPAQTSVTGSSGSCTGNAATATVAARVGHALTFTGGASAVYDGSEAKSVAIPAAVSVKGNAESAYRTGTVNLTYADIGTVPVANGGTGATAAAAALANLGGQPKHKTLSLTLAAASWSASNTCTVTAAGVTAANTVVVAPAPASWAAWGEAGIRCTAQGANSLTFTAEEKPAAAVTAQALIFD